MKFKKRNLGHLRDVAVRLRRGIGHVNGRTIPWHALSKDVLTEQLLEHVRKLDLPYKDKTDHTLADLVSIKNGNYGEDWLNGARYYQWMERDRNGATHF